MLITRAFVKCFHSWVADLGLYLFTHRVLLKNTLTISSINLLASMVGFIRDIILALLFGATAGLDAFLVAFRLPDLTRDLCTDGSFSQALVPTFAQQHATQKQTLQFIGKIFGTLSILLLVVTLLYELAAPLIVLMFAPGFFHDPMRLYAATHMVWIVAPYLFFIVLVAFASALLNSRGIFAPAACAPILLNIVLLVVGFYLSRFFSIPEMSLAVGVLVAGFVQFIFLIPFLKTLRLFSFWQWGWADSQVRIVLKRFLPILFGAAIAQVSLLITAFFASFLNAGSISWLYYGQRLAFFPLALVSGSLATAILPMLSLSYLKGNSEVFDHALDWALRLLLILAIPCAVGLIVLSGPLIITLFKHGEFTLTDSLMTMQCLRAFAIGLPAFMAIKIFASVFYARQNAKLPTRLALLTVIIAILLSCCLMGPLAHIGLALATSLAAVFNAVLLFIMLLRCKVFKPIPGWTSFLIQLVFANTVMFLFLHFGVPTIPKWLDWNQSQRIMHLFGYLMGAIIIYFCCLWASGMRFAGLNNDLIKQSF